MHLDFLMMLLSIPRFGQPPLTIWWGDGVREENLSLCSEVARPLAWVACTGGCGGGCCSSLFEAAGGKATLLFPLLLLLLVVIMEEESVVVGAEETVELIANSSCRFFSYSVCFPCCISSLVKLAASSPLKNVQDYFHVPKLKWSKPSTEFMKIHAIVLWTRHILHKVWAVFGRS